MSDRDRQGYDWLNDPFDEEKQAEDAERAHMTALSRASIVIALLVALFCALMVGSFFWFVWSFGTAGSPGP